MSSLPVVVPAVLAASSFWGGVATLLVAAYVVAVLLKQAARLRGELARLCLFTAVIIVPSLAAAWFAYDGDVFGALRSSAVLDDADRWWMVRIKQEDGEPVTVNVLRASLLLGILAFVASAVVHVGSLVYARGRKTGWLEIHKALIKWPIVVIGGLMLLDIDLSTILLGTSVAVIGIGFMLKETLENLFTGVTVEVEGSVRQGDWIQVGQDTQPGRVVEKTWRATKLRTLNDEIITVPNRLLGSERIKNYNRPTGVHAQLLYVGASYDDPPTKVKEILRAILLSEPAVLHTPLPQVRTLKYNDFSVDYDLKYWIADYAEHQPVRDRIMTHVWYAFRFHGVTIPFPIRTVHLKERAQLAEEEAAHGADVAGKAEFLRGLSCFAGLSAKDLGFVAENAFAKAYEPGDTVLHKGEVGDALYLVQQGSCRAMLPDGAREIEAGSYFGEMGLLETGPRSVDVLAGSEGALLLRVDRRCMEVLFRNQPGLRDEFVAVRDARAKELPRPAGGGGLGRAPWATRARRALVDVLRPW